MNLCYLYGMFGAFKTHISREFPNLKNKALLVACSGGLDSVVLVHLCQRLQFNFSVAHCNFRLRGKESDADEEFVQALCRSLGKTYHITHFDTVGYVNKHRISVQMAARELRYHWFSELMSQKGIELLLTAHHADDALETFLINLSRGTGLEGLNGIPEKTNTICRPLLPFTREQIKKYALKNKLEWREDSSNSDTKYLRNKIRLKLAPIIKELHPAFMANFRQTQRHLSGSASIVKQHVGVLKSKWFRPADGHYRIPVEPLEALSPQEDYLHMLFSEYGFKDGAEVAALLRSGSGKYRCSTTHRLIKDRDALLLEEIHPRNGDSHSFSLDAAFTNAPLNLNVSEVAAMEDTSPYILYVDKETLNPVVTLRKWHKGDYFYPLGMKGKKKVSKFFKDEKMDLIAKEAQWLLCSGDQIVWIVGKRADDRFKVTGKTQSIIKISWEA